MNHDRNKLVIFSYGPYLRCTDCGQANVTAYDHMGWNGKLVSTLIKCGTPGCKNESRTRT